VIECVCPAKSERKKEIISALQSTCFIISFNSFSHKMSSNAMAEVVGDFYVHLVDGAEVSRDLTSSTKLLTSKKIPTVMHFYDGG